MKNQVNFILISIGLNLIYFSLGLKVFSLDDAYIVLKTSENLITHGMIFSYSNLDSNTNAITSFLFYIVSTFVLLFTKLIGTPVVQTYTFILLTLNLYLLINTLADTYRIIIHKFDKKFSISFVIFIGTLYPLALIWTNGLETSISLFIVVLIIRKLLTQNYHGILIVIALLIWSRPDLGISAVITIFIMSIFRILPNYKHFFYSLGFFIVPLIISKFATGEFLSSSISRIPLGSNNEIIFKLVSAVKNLLRTPIYFLNFPIPHEGFNYLNKYLPTSLKYTAIIFIVPILIYLWSRIDKIGKDRFKLIKNEAIKHPELLGISVFLLTLILVGSLTGTGLGEFNRYFVFTYIIMLILLQQLKIFGLFWVRIFIAINILMLPAAVFEIASINSFNNRVLFPTAQKIGALNSLDKTLMLDTAGLMSMYYDGNVIDVYGLGTKRYSKVHGDFEKVYKLIIDDRPDYIVAWVTEKPKYYLDSAHYKIAIKNVELVPIMSKQDNFMGQSNFPKLALFKVNYP